MVGPIFYKINFSEIKDMLIVPLELKHFVDGVFYRVKISFR